MSFTLTVAVPNYQRPAELDYLLSTLSKSVELPDEILVLDDRSPSAGEVASVLNKWAAYFQYTSVRFKWQRNEFNLGYDRNLRELIRTATSDFITFIGNDDAFPASGIGAIRRFIGANPDVKACSRSFYRFHDSLKTVIGVSRFAEKDKVFSQHHDSPRFYFRLAAYFGGVTFNRKWALSKDTNAFDGTLYYQVYLSGCAFYESGIGYIAEPAVGARIDGMPLFGAASSEAHIHVPGQYSAAARADMWRCVLYISDHIDTLYGGYSKSFIQHELMTRMSFHVFESYASRSVQELFALGGALRKLGLMSHPIPTVLFAIVFLLRRHSAKFFFLVRKLYQK